MPLILAPAPAIVKPADPASVINAALLDAWLADRSAEVPAADLLDDAWPLADGEGDRLAAMEADSIADDAVCSGHWAW